jgi:hypothetical protein
LPGCSANRPQDFYSEAIFARCGSRMFSCKGQPSEAAPLARVDGLEPPTNVDPAAARQARLRLRRYLGPETAGCPPPARQCNLRPRFGFTDLRVTQFTEMLWARGTPAPLVTLWKPLAPLRRGFSLRSSSPRHSLPLIEVWLLTHPPHIAGPHTGT